MPDVEPVAGAPLGRSARESMRTESRSGLEKRFSATGGELGVVIGVAAMVSARLAVEFFGPVRSVAGAGLGIVVPSLMVLLALAVVALIGAPLVLRRSRAGPAHLVRPGMLALLLMFARVGSHEAAIRATLPDLGGAPPIVLVHGFLLDDPASGSSVSSEIGHRSWRCLMRVDSASHPMLEDRRLAVAFPTSDARLVAGARVTMLGRLETVRPPGNPGERDRRRGRRDAVPASLVVTAPALVTVNGFRSGGLTQASRRVWREAARTVDELLESRGGRGPGLVTAVLAGDRRRLEPSIREAAEDAGVAPMLAISGWHLGLIAAIVTVVVGRHRPIGRIIALIVITMFMLAVVPGPSVRRAATMAVLSGLLLLRGRRPRSLPVVAIGSALLSWTDPTIIESIGFVLSVVATIALVVGVGPARSRWFGARDRSGRRRSSLLRDPLSDVATASMVAWSVSAPIVLAAFGRLSWIAVPAMIIVAPAFVVVMVSAMITTIAAIIFGAVPTPLLLATGLVIDGLVWILEAVSEVAPTTMWMLPHGVGLPAIGVAACLLVSFGRGSFRSRWSWRLAAMLLLSCSIAFLRCREIGVRPGLVRVDAIAVGDGTSILVRGSEGSVLVDAGSSSVRGVGRRILLPTLRALGVRSLDAVIVTHANHDHFGEVGSVVRGIPVDTVVVSSMLLDDARRRPDSVIGAWFHDLRMRDVTIRETSRGERLRFRDLECRVIHPVRGEPCRSTNDASIVATFHLVGRPDPRASLLICGDIQDEAMARVMNREPALGADIMELPHHGSWRPIAATLLARVDPGAIVQSTGPDRWWLDRWRDACGPRPRGITARDGLVSFEVDSKGRVRSLGSGRSEEPEPGFVSPVRRTSVGPGPDDHDGSVDPRALGKRAVEDTGHAFEERGAR